MHPQRLYDHAIQLTVAARVAVAASCISFLAHSALATPLAGWSAPLGGSNELNCSTGPFNWDEVRVDEQPTSNSQPGDPPKNPPDGSSSTEEGSATPPATLLGSDPDQSSPVKVQPPPVAPASAKPAEESAANVNEVKNPETVLASDRGAARQGDVAVQAVSPLLVLLVGVLSGLLGAAVTCIVLWRKIHQIAEKLLSGSERLAEQVAVAARKDFESVMQAEATKKNDPLNATMAEVLKSLTSIKEKVRTLVTNSSSLQPISPAVDVNTVMAEGVAFLILFESLVTSNHDVIKTVRATTLALEAAMKKQNSSASLGSALAATTSVDRAARLGLGPRIGSLVADAAQSAFPPPNADLETQRQQWAEATSLFIEELRKIELTERLTAQDPALAALLNNIDIATADAATFARLAHSFDAAAQSVTDALADRGPQSVDLDEAVRGYRAIREAIDAVIPIPSRSEPPARSREVTYVIAQGQGQPMPTVQFDAIRLADGYPSLPRLQIISTQTLRSEKWWASAREESSLLTAYVPLIEAGHKKLLSEWYGAARNPQTQQAAQRTAVRRWIEVLLSIRRDDLQSLAVFGAMSKERVNAWDSVLLHSGQAAEQVGLVLDVSAESALSAWYRGDAVGVDWPTISPDGLPAAIWLQPSLRDDNMDSSHAQLGGVSTSGPGSVGVVLVPRVARQAWIKAIVMLAQGQLSDAVTTQLRRAWNAASTVASGGSQSAPEHANEVRDRFWMELWALTRRDELNGQNVDAVRELLVEGVSSLLAVRAVGPGPMFDQHFSAAPSDDTGLLRPALIRANGECIAKGVRPGSGAELASNTTKPENSFSTSPANPSTFVESAPSPALQDAVGTLTAPPASTGQVAKLEAVLRDVIPVEQIADVIQRWTEAFKSYRLVGKIGEVNPLAVPYRDIMREASKHFRGEFFPPHSKGGAWLARLNGAFEEYKLVTKLDLNEGHNYKLYEAPPASDSVMPALCDADNLNSALVKGWHPTRS